MQDKFNIIDMSRYPLTAIGEIAARKCENVDGFVAEFAERNSVKNVVISTDIEKLEDGTFHVLPGLYATVPEEAVGNAFPVNSDVTELELAVAVAASISLGMILLGADPGFLVEGAEYDDVMLAMFEAVDDRTAATNPEESASILSDVVRWQLDRYELEMVTS